MIECRFAHLAMEFFIGEKLDRFFCKLFDIAHFDDETRFVIDIDLRQAADVAGNNRYAAGHCFQCRKAEAFIAGWNNENIADRKDRRKLCLLTEKSRLLPDAKFSCKRFAFGTVGSIAYKEEFRFYTR